jgi:hypothetical protein
VQIEDLVEDLVEELATQNKWVLEDGKIFEKPIGNAKPQHEVLNTPKISIKSKGSCSPTFEGEKLRYSFELDHNPCDTWINLFQANLDADPRASIQGRTLSFDCFENSVYAKVKRVEEAIEKTNTGYPNVKELVIAVLQAAQKRSTEKQKQDEERLKKAREEFDKLEL